MRFYLVHKDEIINEVGDAGYGMIFSKKGLQLAHPEEKVEEIIEEDYKKIKNNLEYFIYKDKIVEISSAEKALKEVEKQKYRDENSIEGLKSRIEKLELEINKLKK